MTRQDVADRAALLQRGVQRIDRRARHAKGDRYPFLFEDSYGCIDRPHLRHVAPRSTLLALAAIFAAARCDLNAGDFISRGVEGIGERDEKSTGYCHHEMEMPCIGEDLTTPTS
jgi:hypothetical protein